MQHEKIIKRADGSEVKYQAFLHNSKIEYLAFYRRNRESGWFLQFLGEDSEMYTTPEEILAAKLELWELLKPV